MSVGRKKDGGSGGHDLLLLMREPREGLLSGAADDISRAGHIPAGQDYLCVGRSRGVEGSYSGICG